MCSVTREFRPLDRGKYQVPQSHWGVARSRSSSKNRTNTSSSVSTINWNSSLFCGWANRDIKGTTGVWTILPCCPYILSRPWSFRRNPPICDNKSNGFGNVLSKSKLFSCVMKTLTGQNYALSKLGLLHKKKLTFYLFIYCKKITLFFIYVKFIYVKLYWHFNFL